MYVMTISLQYGKPQINITQLATVITTKINKKLMGIHRVAEKKKKCNQLRTNESVKLNSTDLSSNLFE